MRNLSKLDITLMLSVMDEKLAEFMKINYGVTIFIPVTRTIESIRILLRAGADASCATSCGQTPLALCACSNTNADWRVTVADLLIERGADPNAADCDGRAPLLMAAMARGSGPIIRMLARVGAELEAVDNRGSTALHHAVRSLMPDSVHALLELGADEWCRNADGDAPVDMLPVCLREQSDITAARAIGRHFVGLRKFEYDFRTVFNRQIETAILRDALDEKNAAVAEVALTAGADPDTAMPDFQADFGANPWRQGLRALHYAVMVRDIDSVRTLLDHGADVNFPDAWGLLPLDMVNADDYPAIAELLIRYGASWSRRRW